MERNAALALWSLAALVLAALVRNGATRGYDLEIVHAAGQHLLHGDPVYADPLFLYLPSSALLAAPFGALPLTAATALGAVLAGAALVWLCWSSVRLLAPAPAWCPPLALVVVLLSAAGGSLMDTLNVEFLPLAALPVLYRWAAAGRWTAFGALLGVTIAVKPILAPLVLLPLLARRWRPVLLAGAEVGVLCGVALLLMPGRAHVLDTALQHLSGASQPAFQNADASITGVFRSFGVSGNPVRVTRVAVCLLGVGAALLRWARTTDPVLRVVETGTLLLLTSVVTASLAWSHYALFAVPALLFVTRPGSLVRRAWLVWPCLINLLVVLPPIPSLAVAHWDLGARYGLSLLAVLLVLAVTTFREALRSRTRGPASALEPNFVYDPDIAATPPVLTDR